MLLYQKVKVMAPPANSKEPGWNREQNAIMGAAKVSVEF